VVLAKGIRRQKGHDRLADSSWIRLDDLTPIPEPVRTKRCAWSSVTHSSIPAPMPDAAANVETASGPTSNGDTSTSRRASGAADRAAPLTILIRASAAEGRPVRIRIAAMIRTSSSTSSGLPLDSRTTTRAVRRAISSDAPSSVSAMR